MLLAMRLRNVPRWNVPVWPDEIGLSPEDYEAALHERESRIASRQTTVAALAEPILSDLESLGATGMRLSWRTGWVEALVPVESVEALISRDDIIALKHDSGDGAVPDAAAGPGTLGGQRSNARIGAAEFFANGYDGGRDNSTQTGVSDIAIGIVETYKVEDEACAFANLGSCSFSRFYERYECAGSCASVLDVDDCEVGSCPSTHPTIVASVAAADYSGAQGRGRALNDPAWTCVSGCSGVDHADDWEDAATGMAPEARIVFASFVDNAPYLEAGARHGYEELTERPNGKPVDIINGSHTFAASCDIGPAPGTIGDLEESIENAYLEGVLVVNSAGNFDGASDAACSVGTPAIVPVSMAVNGLDASQAACQADYNDCRLDANNSARGDSPVDGGGTHNVIALAAPQKFTHYTTQTGLEGQVENSASGSGGTSFAAPVVAGAAALVKDQYLAGGQTWVNSPGRLYTLMLSMGDRHYDPGLPGAPGATVQRALRSDAFFGFGKLRLRRMGSITPSVLNFHTYTFSSQTDHNYFPFGTGAGSQPTASTELLKCVLFAEELMYNVGKTGNDLTYLWYNVQVKNIGANNICEAADTNVLSYYDNSYDHRKVVAVRAADVGGSFAGKCVYIREMPREALETPTLTTFSLCYHSAVNDDEDM